MLEVQAGPKPEGRLHLGNVTAFENGKFHGAKHQVFSYILNPGNSQ